MKLVTSAQPRLKALANAAGSFEIYFEGFKLPSNLAVIGANADGAHYLTIQFPVSAIDLGNVPMRAAPIQIEPVPGDIKIIG